MRSEPFLYQNGEGYLRVPARLRSHIKVDVCVLLAGNGMVQHHGGQNGETNAEIQLKLKAETKCSK